MRPATLTLALILAQAQPPPQPPPTFRGGTNIVLVDVSVVGPDSRDVEDLTAADFEVLDDGQPVLITSVRHISGWDRSGAEELYPIRTVEDEQREAARDDVRLFAIFLDEYHIGRMEPLKMIGPLTDFVRALPAADMVAVYSPGLSARDIRFTRDRESVIRAIRAFQGRQGIYTPPKYPFEEEHLRSPLDIERLRMDVTVSSIIGAVIHLDTLKEGRKSLLLVTQRIRDVIDIYWIANQSNVAIYPIDPQGLGLGSNRAAEDWLRVLADETGGRALVNTNNLRGGLSHVLDDSGAYYLIGYVSPHPNDGKFHTITVRARPPKARVQARKGYWALTAGQAAQAAAAPIEIAAPVRDALNALAAALRSGSETPPSPIVLTAGQESTARRTFTRNERLVARATVGDGSSVTAKARLLSRLGQPLVDLPVSVTGGACEVILALGSLGVGDYVIVMTIQSGSAVAERYVAFRLAR